MQALGQLDLAERRLVARIDALARDEIQQLLDVEGIALRALGDELDECGGRVRVGAEKLAELRADQLRRRPGVELGERRARQLRQVLRPMPPTSVAPGDRRARSAPEATRARARAPRADRATAGRASGNPRARAPAAPRRARARGIGKQAIRARSCAASRRTAVSSLSRIGRSSSAPSSGARATSEASIAASSRSSALHLLLVARSSSRPNSVDQISRQTK